MLKTMYGLLVFAFTVMVTASESSQSLERNKLIDGYQNTSKQFELSGKLLWTFTLTDIVSSETAFANGAYVGNPAMKNRAVRIGYKIGTAYVANEVTKKMKNRKLASIIRWSLVGVMAFATGNNVVLSF